MALTDILGASGTWGIIKIMFLLGMALYIVFAFVILRQITHMNKTLKVGFETPVYLVGLVHFVASIALLILAFFYL